jgi:hypothetical protein
MKDMGIIQGSAAQAVPLIIGKDTVYVHTDITPVEGEEGLFQYHEIQYEKDEYIKLMAGQGILHDGYLLDLDFRLSLSELGV